MVNVLVTGSEPVEVEREVDMKIIPQGEFNEPKRLAKNFSILACHKLQIKCIHVN